MIWRSTRSGPGQAHGLVFPLLTNTSGGKFGKSESGNVWLDPERTSPYRFYQFWLNVEDADAERLLRLFTFLPLDEIARCMDGHRNDPASRAAQRLLAREVTALVHGEDAVERAVAASAAVFGGRGEDADYAALAETMPNVPATLAELEGGLPLADVLVRAGLASSKGEARRGIEGRGFSVNDVAETDVQRRLTRADLRQERYVMLRKGKKNHAMLVVER